MAQKIQVYKNVNENSPVFGKYFVRPVYDDKYITTEDLADFIQMQATVKRSDCKAVVATARQCSMNSEALSSTFSSWVRKSSSTTSASSRLV